MPLTLNLPPELEEALRAEPAFTYARFEETCLRALREAIKAPSLERDVLKDAKGKLMAAATDLFALANLGVQSIRLLGDEKNAHEHARAECHLLATLVYTALDMLVADAQTAADRERRIAIEKLKEDFAEIGYDYPKPEPEEENEYDNPEEEP